MLKNESSCSYESYEAYEQLSSVLSVERARPAGVSVSVGSGGLGRANISRSGHVWGRRAGRVHIVFGAQTKTSPMRRYIMLWLSLFAPTRVDAGCESWCVVAQCSELNGPVQAECGSCDSNAKCWPRLAHPTTVPCSRRYGYRKVRVIKVAVGNSAAVRQQQQHVADPMASANIASNVAARPCKPWVRGWLFEGPRS